MEFVQEARSGEGRTLVSSSNIFQKLRSEATTRIEKEMSEDLAPERECGVWLTMPVASGAPLRATILGPEGSPYEGGRFDVEITVPRSYPFVSPKCRFLTKIWHPNVDHKTGEVCLVDIPPSLLLIKILIHYQVETWKGNAQNNFAGAPFLPRRGRPDGRGRGGASQRPAGGLCRNCSPLDLGFCKSHKTRAQL